MTLTMNCIKQLVIERIDKLCKEVEKAEANWIKKGDTHHRKGYVYKGNIVVYENELDAIRRARDKIELLNPHCFPNIDSFKKAIKEKLIKLENSCEVFKAGTFKIHKMIEEVHRECEARECGTYDK